MKRYILLVVTIIVLGAGTYFSEKSFLVEKLVVEIPEETPSSSTSNPPIVSTSSSAKISPVTPRPASNIVISIGSTAYFAYVPENSSVLDAMRILTSTTNFTFTGKEYPSLGFFVDSINSKKNANGLYWILYINGKSSDVGASQATINSGDKIEWMYEKSY
ncbi:MAG: DUF4430 domain-containing protein [bacterium]|nr:DUF4430 domain-containing protein [bacterium]